MKLSKSKGTILGALSSNAFAFLLGGRMPIVAWIGAALSVGLSLIGIYLAVRGRSGLWITIGLFAVLASVPILFLAGAWFACVVNSRCL